MIARPCLYAAAAASLLSLATAASVRAQPQLEVMPGLTVGKPTGEGTEDAYDLGPGLWLAIGARLHPMASLHGQLNADRHGPRLEHIADRHEHVLLQTCVDDGVARHGDDVLSG